MNAVAIVDLDNTLVRGSYLFHFGMSLVRRRLLTPRPVVPFLLDEYRFVRSRGERSGLPERVTESVLSCVAGRDQDALVDLCGQFVADSLDRFVVPEVLEAVRDLQDLGFPAYVATASPQELADQVARTLGLAGAIGTVAEVDGGRYTGRLASPITHGTEKLVRVQALLTGLGADASASWAFSDSINDLPLLSAVGWPVAVNPDQRLRAIAVSRSWLTIDRSSRAPEDRWVARWTQHPAKWLRDDPAAHVPMH